MLYCGNGDCNKAIAPGNKAVEVRYGAALYYHDGEFAEVKDDQPFVYCSRECMLREEVK